MDLLFLSKCFVYAFICGSFMHNGDGKIEINNFLFHFYTMKRKKK